MAKELIRPEQFCTVKIKTSIDQSQLQLNEDLQRELDALYKGAVETFQLGKLITGTIIAIEDNGVLMERFVSVKKTDQIADLLTGIKNDPFGRRHVVTGWNPGQLNEMALPPCHMMHMYSVEGEFNATNGRLNNSFVMRSNDVPFGLPFNIAGYALLNHIFAKHLIKLNHYL